MLSWDWLLWNQNSGFKSQWEGDTGCEGICKSCRPFCQLQGGADERGGCFSITGRLQRSFWGELLFGSFGKKKVQLRRIERVRGLELPWGGWLHCQNQRLRYDFHSYIYFSMFMPFSWGYLNIKWDSIWMFECIYRVMSSVFGILSLLILTLLLDFYPVSMSPVLRSLVRFPPLFSF